MPAHYEPAIMKILFYIYLFFCNEQLFGQHSDTVQLKNNLVILFAYDDDKIIKEGDSLFDRNMINEAIAKYSIVIELSPKNKIAITNRAFAYLQFDDYIKSLNDYNVAINLDTTDYINLSNRALVKWYLKNYRGGIIDCDIALTYNPSYAYAYFHKGICHFELNNYKEAIICYDKAIQIDSTFSRAFYNRGNSKFELNNLPSACVDWEKAKALGHNGAKLMLQKYCR